MSDLGGPKTSSDLKYRFMIIAAYLHDLYVMNLVRRHLKEVNEICAQAKNSNFKPSFPFATAHSTPALVLH